MVLKPQDVFALLKVALLEDQQWSYPSLAHALFMSVSETHAAIKRAEAARLIDLTRKTVRKRNLTEFLVHGVKYAYPPQRGGATSAAQSSITAITRVAKQLGALREQVVFLGGAVTGLLVTDVAAPEARFTEDGDVVIPAASRISYYRWEKSLESLGFMRRRQEGDPLCRGTASGVVVDVMPLVEDVLGFGSRWYASAMVAAETFILPGSRAIRVVTAPYFLATKAAFVPLRCRSPLARCRQPGAHWAC